MLTSEERELRRKRMDKMEQMIKSFDPEFDAAPYTYSELIKEAREVLMRELVDRFSQILVETT